MLHKFRVGLRRLIRDNTRPIPQPSAIKWHKNLSVWYFMFSWTALGLCFYTWIKNRDKPSKPKDPYPALSLARSRNMANATVIKYDGFTKVGEYQIKDYEIWDAEEIKS